MRRHQADLQPFRKERKAGRLADPLPARGLSLEVQGEEPVDSDQSLGLPTVAGSSPETPRDASIGTDADSLSVHGFEEALETVFQEKEKVKRLFDEARRVKQSRAPEKTRTPAALPAKRASASEAQQVTPSSCSVNAVESCGGHPVHSELFSTTCMAQDIFSKRYGSPCGDEDSRPRATQPDSVEDLADWQAQLIEEGLESFFRPRLPEGSTQSVATYPPILPRKQFLIITCKRVGTHVWTSRFSFRT